MKRLLHHPAFLYFYLLLLAGVIVGCNSNAPRPDTPHKGLAYAYATLETAVDSVTAARDAGLLNSEQVDKIKVDLVEALDTLDEATALAAAYQSVVMPPGTESDIQFRIAQALMITSTVQQLLCEANDGC